MRSRNKWGKYFVYSIVIFYLNYSASISQFIKNIFINLCSSSDSFNVAMDKVLNQTTGRAMVETSLGKAKFTDLDFADNVVLFSEL